MDPTSLSWISHTRKENEHKDEHNPISEMPNPIIATSNFGPNNIFCNPKAQTEESITFGSIMFLKTPAPLPSNKKPESSTTEVTLTIDNHLMSQPILQRALPNNDHIILSEKVDHDSEKVVIKTLKNLYDLLIVLFCRLNAKSLDFNLSLMEIQLLNLILRRKAGHKNTASLKTITKEVNYADLSRIIAEMKSKRPEECLKFVFSRGFKHLMKHFDAQHKKKADAERAFYHFYFADLAAKMKTGIETFHNPISMKNGTSQTNFNQKYFSNVFKSKSFLNDFLEYLRLQMTEEYKSEVKKKLELLLKKWEKSDINAIDLKEASDYLLKNKKCKLPWTIDEVRTSIMSFVMMIKDLNPDAKIDDENFFEQSQKS